ncbi:MAG: TraB/GumN family protein [Verrucomicrobiaceae bacterium]|nr:MAG: TraB/GumN family protein [Verrucomicrobiaceae bacterium]
MKRITFLARTVMFLAAGCLAVNAQEAAPKHPEKPLLWKVEGDNLKNPSYLFGTIHLSTPPVGNLHPAAEKAFESANVVLTEIPMDLKTQMAMVPMFLRQDGKTLDDAIGEKLAAELNAELKAINPELDSTPFQTFKTWAIAMILPMLKSQLTGDKPLDSKLWDRATAAGKETGALETAEGQLAIFEEFNEVDQTIILAETIKQIRDDRAAGKDATADLIKAYATGDAAKVQKEMDKSVEKIAAGAHKELGERFMKLLLTDRDVTIAKAIDDKLVAAPDKIQFFAVGAAHYVGKPGIRSHLEKRGYRITAITE